MLSVKLDQQMTVSELLIIGTALKNAKAVINEDTETSSGVQGVDEALEIIERIIDEGT